MTMAAPALRTGAQRRRSLPSATLVLAALTAAAFAAMMVMHEPVDAWVGSAAPRALSAGSDLQRPSLVACRGSARHVTVANPKNIKARFTSEQYHFDEDGGMYDIIKYPLLSQKACRLLEEQNVYTFLVDRRANKPQIRAAVETIFGVKVNKVNTLIPHSKYTVRFGTPVGRKALHKKAYVFVKEGDSIDLFPDDPDAM
eukprot:TRINITY_DN3383_c0_g1_i1.p2 TRINITY_DN3383_c0_g1~~TRINITY_DN3383_c0_g1_i1.p2  ORF type:complete len:219 (+),score=46.58 TRINITY_DN3383_c0_g1_i1:63-659(+)